MEGVGKVQFGLYTARFGNLLSLGRRRPVWSLGQVWAPQCGVGQLCPIRGLYGQAQLVFTGREWEKI